MNRRLFSYRLRMLFSRAIHWSISLIWIVVLFAPASLVQAQTGDVGYRIFTYPSGTGGNSDATGEKPESKLWWNDGSWYAVMWSSSGRAFRLFRLDIASQTWTDTGVNADDRLGTKQDVLWDGTKLYIVSHLFVTLGAAAPAGQRGELFRYSYNPSSKTYSLDTGFPVEVTGGVSETLVIDKDSSGTLWVTYVENKTVMVNHSLNGDDRMWGTPFALPAGGAEKVYSDDISSVITYNQHVGIMWSNQVTPKTMYFAVHPVGAPDSTWTRARAYSISGDDHISLKTMQSDNAGNLFAVVKTSKNSALIMLLVCKNNGNRCKNDTDWTPYTVYNSATYNPTRPILLIDESNRHLYVFTRNEDSDGSGKGGIYYKRANLDGISFPGGMGTPFIRTTLDYRANDPTSTKQNLTTSTGLVVLASDTATKYYLHNYLNLGSAPPPPPPPTISSFSPGSGPTGTEVTINGSNFTNVQEVRFNGTLAASVAPVSSTQVKAVVPTGASSGTISVKTSAGTAASSSSYTVTTAPPPPPPAPVISSFTPASGPVGTEVTLTGSNLSGLTAVSFNGLAAQSFTVDSSTQVRAVVPSAATSGLISVTGPGGTANSSSGFLVTGGNNDPNTYYLSIIIQGGGSVTSSPFLDGYPAGTVVTLTAVPNPGWVFAGWSGAVTGTASPATVTMNANQQVTATFVQSAGVTHQETVNGSALLAQSVSTGGSLTGASGNLYLAAVSSRSSGVVSAVSGLGLNWVRVFRQCAGRNQTMIEVWMAQGTPSAGGPVTATFDAVIKSAVITVSRYSGVNSSQPLGSVAAGNTLGPTGACAGGVDSASYSLPISTGTPGAVVYVAAAMRNRNHTPGSGYTERAELFAGASGDIASVAIADRPAPSPASITANGAFSGTVDWAVVSIEIRP